MSHFTVLVVGDDIEAQLEPFWELDLSNEEMASDSRAEFDDCTEEAQNDWETGGTKQIIETATGNKFYPWDQDLIEKLTGDRYGKLDEDNLPEGYTLKKLPFKEVYTDIETFANEYSGYHVTEDGRFGHYSNPNAKWDWYQIGGRWSGYFRLKDGAAGNLGESGLGGRDKRVENGKYADQCRKGDVDVEWMREQARFKAREYFNALDAVLSKFDNPPTWDEVRDEQFPGEIDKAREFYHKHPAVVALREAKVSSGMFGDGVKDYRSGLDALVQNASDKAISTFAVLLDGEWYQKGEMGWFGVHSEDMKPEDWEAEFTKMFDAIPDDTMITVVDCHI